MKADVTTKRQRRTPAQARAEIIAAVDSALEDLEFNDLTVELLMKRTGMTRSSFYHYFNGLEDVALALLERFEADVAQAVEPWLAEGVTGDPRAATEVNLVRLFEVCMANRTLMSAVEQAAGRSQVVYRKWRSRLIDGFVVKATGFIREQNAAGLSRVDDPERVASALVFMSHAVAMEHMTRKTPDTPQALGKAAAHIWNAAIYGEP